MHHRQGTSTLPLRHKNSRKNREFETGKADLVDIGRKIPVTDIRGIQRADSDPQVVVRPGR